MIRIVTTWIVFAVLTDATCWAIQVDSANPIPIQAAAELLIAAKHQWKTIEGNSVFLQGHITHRVVDVVDGKSAVQMESVVSLSQNKVCGLTISRKQAPKTGEQEIVVKNPWYFAVLSRTAGADMAELAYLEWFTNGQRSKGNHRNWNTIESVGNQTKPSFFDKSTVFLGDLVGHPDFAIQSANLANGILTVDFRLFFPNPSDTGGFDDILGGRIVLNESQNWLPIKVVVDAGAKSGIVYVKKSLVLVYQEPESMVAGNAPVLKEKLFTNEVVNQIPNTPLRPGFVETHQMKMELQYVDKLPANSAFCLAAFGLPEPERPVSVASAWWKWGGRTIGGRHCLCRDCDETRAKKVNGVSTNHWFLIRVDRA